MQRKARLDIRQAAQKESGADVERPPEQMDNRTKHSPQAFDVRLRAVLVVEDVLMAGAVSMATVGAGLRRECGMC